LMAAMWQSCGNGLQKDGIRKELSPSHAHFAKPLPA